MKKIAIAAAGLSLLGLGACVSPAYAPYYGNAEGHDGHGDSAYYVHPNGNCVVPSALVGGLAGWLVGWLVGWPVGWLTGWLVGCLSGWLAGWCGGCSYSFGQEAIASNTAP